MSSRCKSERGRGVRSIRSVLFSVIAPVLSFSFLLLFSFIFPPSLHAWGDAGHRIVADLAEGYLDHRAREEIRTLIGETSLASVSGWADLVRGERPETARWHFVNIPFKGSRYDPKRDCSFPKKGDCAIAAIERFKAVLSDRMRPSTERTEALKFLVHLVADLHQPLHTADRRDRGGNDLPVTFFGEKFHSGERPWNLHAVWDGGLIDRTGLSERAYVDHLQLRLKKEPIPALQKGSVVDWALESHHIAVAVAYRVPKDRKLSKDYFEKNVPVMDRLLAKAAVRLARVLNEAFGAAQ